MKWNFETLEADKQPNTCDVKERSLCEMYFYDLEHGPVSSCCHVTEVSDIIFWQKDVEFCLKAGILDVFSGQEILFCACKESRVRLVPCKSYFVHVVTCQIRSLQILFCACSHVSDSFLANSILCVSDSFLAYDRTVMCVVEERR